MCYTKKSFQRKNMSIKETYNLRQFIHKTNMKMKHCTQQIMLKAFLFGTMSNFEAQDMY